MTASPDHILQAFYDTLSALALPVVLPNRGTLPELPYLVLQMVSRETDDRSLGGDMEHVDGTAAITVVSALNGFTKPGDDLAVAVKELFPRLMTMTTLTGPVQVIRPTAIGVGYADEVNWRTPVLVRWRAQ